MDEFKAIMHTCVGIGGLHCPCCNDYHGKTKNRMDRLARRTLKKSDRKVAEKIMMEEELRENRLE